MAKYSDNREQNREMKYLYKVWSGVDRQIQLPDSLSGKALLHLIEDIPEPVPQTKVEREPRRKTQFAPHFSWKHGVAYAAALVLIIALSATFGRTTTNPNLVAGTIPANGEPSTAIEEHPVSQSAVIDETQSQPQPQEVAPANEEPVPVEVAPPVEPDGQESDALGVGGQGLSVLLGSDETYIYTYRANDASDPDKQGVPLTLNIVHESSGALAFEIDLTNLQTIDQYFVSEQQLVLVGQSPSDVLALEVYDLSRVGQSVQQIALQQPGELVAANQYKNLVYLVSQADANADLDCEITELPDAAGDDLCIITALHLDTLETERAAYQGADGEISLYNLNAYLQYADEDGEQRVAHIRLDGTNLELREAQEAN